MNIIQTTLEAITIEIVEPKAKETRETTITTGTEATFNKGQGEQEGQGRCYGVMLVSSPQGSLMESVVLRFLCDVATDPDVHVRCRTAQLLVQLLTKSSPKWSKHILAIINSILRNGMEVASKTKDDKVRMECKFCVELPNILSLLLLWLLLLLVIIVCFLN